MEAGAAYIRDVKTGKPVKDNDHAMDALRIAIATFNITGLVYVYREIYDLDPPSLDRSVAQIHDLSGWVLPKDALPTEITLYDVGDTGEEYESNVADRSQPKTIELFAGWGITPLVASRKPGIVSGPSRGEVEDGIALVSTLISGKTRFAPHVREENVEIHDKVAQNAPRPTNLTHTERRRLRDERVAIMNEELGQDFDDDDTGGPQWTRGRVQPSSRPAGCNGRQ